ncbi:Protein Rf1, mitochondrial [Sphaceloma murrayae]|uniref:Protein Rf1, mitochondrial n=1 Tax=Sphaceloma murrayae TaxID=2082308 RepID=A0A2K1QQK5_9PEZI|nr:Protein Rf1, mitochondrial [Sphaceloma murrayae]
MSELALCNLYVLEKGLAHSKFRGDFARYEPFAQDMNALLSCAIWTKEMKRSVTTHLAKHVDNRGHIESFLSWLRPKVAVDETGPALKDFGPSDSIESFAERVSTSLARYTERENVALVQEAWTAVKSRLSSATEEERASGALSTIYDEFLFSFRSLRQASSTVQVWNTMISNGTMPTRKTWNVMLKGCHIGREVDQMEDIWRRMLRAGVEPDEVSWSTRIHGLFKFDRVPQAFQALADISVSKQHVAKASVKGQPLPPEQVKPTLVILNNALSGAQHLGPEMIGRILAWGRGQLIEPDITTYNILINASLHSGQREQTRKILAHMASRNVRPDGATFTVLLHALFQDGFLSNLSKPEQQTQALAYIANLESDGLAMDERGYALLIDRLLKEYDNEPAAKAILNHMIKRGITPTPHMYTILITHYFAQSPPNIAAVEALWQRLQQSKNYVVDVILYDRLVEGFAKAGEFPKMMYFLLRMSKEGKRPGWLALTEALRCTVRKRGMERARELVGDVLAGEGQVQAGVRGRKGYEEFWRLVDELGLRP